MAKYIGISESKIDVCLKKTFKIDDSTYEIHMSFGLCSAVFYFFRCSLPSARHDGVRFLASSSITPSSATRSPASGVATTVPTDAQQRPPLLRPPSPPRPRPAAAFPHSKSSTPFFFDLFDPFRPFLSQIDPKNGPPQNGATLIVNLASFWYHFGVVLVSF